MSVSPNADPRVFYNKGYKPRRSHASRLYRFLATTTIVTAVGFPGVVAADSVSVEVTDVTAPTLKVENDGKNYTALSGAGGDIAVDLHLKMDAGLSGKVKFWRIWPELSAQKFGDSVKTKSYAIGDRPKTVDRVETISIKPADYAKVAVQACNNRAKQLRIQGKGNAAIFAADYNIWISVTAGWQYEITGVPSLQPPQEAQLNPAVEVICKKTAMMIGEPAAQVALVKSASLEAGTQNALLGGCSLKLFGSIETNQPNRLVKFRYADETGKKSDVKSVLTGNTKTVDFSHDYDLPKNGGALSGKVRMEGVGTDFVSDWAPYEANCNSGPDDLMTELPPKATILQTSIIDEVVVGSRYVCPSQIRYRGVVEGRGPAKGAAALLADGKSVNFKLHDLKMGDKQYLTTGYDLDWGLAQIAQYGAQQIIEFRMNVTNASNKVVDTVSKTVTFSCKPVISSLSVTAAVEDRALVDGGFFCPITYKIGGSVQAAGATVVKAVLRADGKEVASIPLSLKKGDDRSLIPVALDISWLGVKPTSNGLLQQVPLELSLFGPGNTKFASDSKAQLFQCQRVSGATNAAPALPPKAGILETTVIEERVIFNSQVCPARIRFRGVVEGRGPAKGATTMLAGNVISKIALHDLEKGQKQYVSAVHELDWETAGQGTTRSVDFRINLTDMSKKVVDSVSKKATYSCKPLIPSASVTAVVTKRNLVNGGFLCPVRYRVGGTVAAAGPAVVKAFLRAGGTELAAIPMSLKKGDKRSLLPVHTDLSWSGVTPTANGLLQQVPLQITVKGAGNKKLALGKKTELFRCVKVGATGAPSSAGGSESAEQVPKSHQSQQAMIGAKALQQAGGFNLLAPKGVVSKGEVRLSGGKASSKYKLTFYLKAGGGYKAVKARGLPRKMTGTLAKFNLSALTGGTDWRLEVCPAGTRNKKLCKVSNFRIPAFKGVKTLNKR